MGSKEQNDKSLVGCPYCTKEIPFDAAECPFCGTSFGSQTINILKSFVDDALFTTSEERRRLDRIPKNLKVVYSSANGSVRGYLANISVGGVFIQTDSPLVLGTPLDLKISLPNGEKEFNVRGEVAWIRKKEVRTPTEIFPSGMGIRFASLSPEEKVKLEKIITSAALKP